MSRLFLLQFILRTLSPAKVHSAHPAHYNYLNCSYCHSFSRYPQRSSCTLTAMHRSKTALTPLWRKQGIDVLFFLLVIIIMLVPILTIILIYVSLLLNFGKPPQGTQVTLMHVPLAQMAIASSRGAFWASPPIACTSFAGLWHLYSMMRSWDGTTENREHSCWDGKFCRHYDKDGRFFCLSSTTLPQLDTRKKLYISNCGGGVSVWKIRFFSHDKIDEKEHIVTRTLVFVPDTNDAFIRQCRREKNTLLVGRKGLVPAQNAAQSSTYTYGMHTHIECIHI